MSYLRLEKETVDFENYYYHYKCAAHKMNVINLPRKARISLNVCKLGVVSSEITANNGDLKKKKH